MKKNLQGMIAGVLIGTILASGVVFAKQISETAELFYNNIKIYIDGGEIIPKDANGNVVEPFTINGTTYYLSVLFLMHLAKMLSGTEQHKVFISERKTKQNRIIIWIGFSIMILLKLIYSMPYTELTEV